MSTQEAMPHYWADPKPDYPPDDAASMLPSEDSNGRKLKVAMGGVDYGQFRTWAQVFCDIAPEVFQTVSTGVVETGHKTKTLAALPGLIADWVRACKKYSLKALANTLGSATDSINLWVLC